MFAQFLLGTPNAQTPRLFWWEGKDAPALKATCKAPSNLLGLDSTILFDHRSFPKQIAVSPRILGVLERRMPGKNGECSPRPIGGLETGGDCIWI